MNVLLQSLERDGLVTRPAQAATGRVLPTRLTPPGRGQLEKASAAVRAVEDRMGAALEPAEKDELRRLLKACAASLGSPD